MATPRNNFEVVGLKELIADLNRYPQGARRILRGEVDKGGEVLLRKTKEKVPVRSGNLKNSLHIKRHLRTKGKVINTLTWGDDVRAYAAPLELGHSLFMFGEYTGLRVTPRPFLRPAADEVAPQIEKLLVAAIDRSLEWLGDK